MCDALHYLLDNNFVRFDSKFNRPVLAIQKGTNSASLCFFLIILMYSWIYTSVKDSDPRVLILNKILKYTLWYSGVACDVLWYPAVIRVNAGFPHFPTTGNQSVKSVN